MTMTQKYYAHIIYIYISFWRNKHTERKKPDKKERISIRMKAKIQILKERRCKPTMQHLLTPLQSKWTFWIIYEQINDQQNKLVNQSFCTLRIQTLTKVILKDSFRCWVKFLQIHIQHFLRITILKMPNPTKLLSVLHMHSVCIINQQLALLGFRNYI